MTNLFHPRTLRRSGRVPLVGVLVLVAFVVLLIIVCRGFLIPAIQASQFAGDLEKKRLKAWALFLMMTLLIVLAIGLLLVLGLRRFFFPRARPPRKRTRYTDAWAEAGRRLELHPDDRMPESDDEDAKPDN